jgi:diguanylate cyclase (GGDEF)-like protein
LPNLPVGNQPGQPGDPPHGGQTAGGGQPGSGSGDVTGSGSGSGSNTAPSSSTVADATSGPAVSQPPSRTLSAHSGLVPGFLQPFVNLPPGRTGQVLALGLMFLPLLIGLWLLTMGRTLRAASLVRSSSLRLNVAADLGIRPMELSAMSIESLERVRDEIAVDELTGVARRATGVAALERELARSRRHGRPLVVGFVDVDGLKKVNDSKGHAAGDALLKGVAEVLHKRLRAEDVVFRYGGDEFVCLLADTELQGAQQAFAAMASTANQSGQSFSYGLAEHQPGDDAVSLLGRADKALYDGRKEGPSAGEAVTWRESRRRPLTS